MKIKFGGHPGIEVTDMVLICKPCFNDKSEYEYTEVTVKANLAEEESFDAS